MSALTVTLGADISALKRSMASATQLVSASAKKMASLSAAGLKVGIGAALAGGGVALAAGIKAVTSAADFEQTKVAFTTLIGDAGKAEQTLAQLRELGAKTPFEFPELADAGRKLIAFGEGSDTVAATLARIGDVSAGVQAPVNEIAELYGKARVQGRLFAEDINQLTGRGIPIIGELAKQFGVSDSEVKKLVESGQVGFPQIEQAFVNMTSQGGKFSGMMEAQSKTTNGLFSTLKDTINEVFLTLGTPINDAIRPLVEQAIALAQKLAPLATEAGAKIRDAIQYVIAVFRSGEFLNLVGTALKLGFDLKTIYSAPTEKAARAALEAFRATHDARHPAIGRSWEAHWHELTPFFDFPPEIRRIIYTTNAVESLNSSFRKISRHRNLFPSVDSLFKLFYLSLKNISSKWTLTVPNWPRALSYFAIEFEDRMPNHHQ